MDNSDNAVDVNDATNSSDGDVDVRNAANSDAAVIERLVANHREFRRFLESKLGDSALADDILQEAFVRGLAKVGGIRDDESAKAWFYRVLRNAVIDHARRRAAASRRLEAFARELENEEEQPETMGQVCQCVSRLANTLKPEYADAIERIEVEGMSVKDFATSAGISSGNAAVRVFRAREALRNQVMRSCGTCAEHGCMNCSCGKS
jgi:RNA polymerase sigma factor (sigma-70 family)